MTPDTIRSLPSGAELDAVIAGLLGWTVDGQGFWFDAQKRPRNLPVWSTFVGHAIHLIMAAGDRKWPVEISNGKGRDEDRWMAGINLHDWYAETLSEAVSKAFALAVLQQPKE
jgi:hypothetical protein